MYTYRPLSCVSKCVAIKENGPHSLFPLPPPPLHTHTGIMAVLFSGIVMSHYTHFNLSPVTQVTVQQTMRTVAFMAGQTDPVNSNPDTFTFS